MGNRYLEGNFAPVRDELTLTELNVTGEIPEHLDGRYARIGPNPLGQADPATYHWFTGDGMVHGVRLRDGRAEWYRNRWVRSADVAARLGEPRRPGASTYLVDFAANTNVITQGGRTFALVEAGPRPYELTYELDTVGPCDFDGSLPGGYTAHPHRDPETGELHAISYCFGWGNRVQYSVVGTDARVRRTVDIQVHGSPMIHDFSLTENYVLVYDLPVVFDVELAAPTLPRPLRRPAKALARVLGSNPVPEPVAARLVRFGTKRGVQLPYRWDPGYPARVGVLPREGSGSDLRWFDVEPCYVFHPLNAYEEGDSIVVDVVRHPKMFATDLLGPNEGAPTLDRWTIDLNAGKVREERLDDRGQEFPRIDERLTGRPHRYGYTVGFGTAVHDDAVVKHDMNTGRSTVRSLGDGRSASEFVFAPDNDAAAEDQGVLMGYVYDAATDRSDLTLLDAQTLETVAQVQLPVRVPYGFHGNWLPTTP